MSKDADVTRVIFGFIFWLMVASVVIAIGLWYLALFALAVVLFVVIVLVASKQHKKTRSTLAFRPGKIIPAEVWEHTKGREVVPAPDQVEIVMVGLDKYADNWAKVRQIAQVERSGDITVHAYLIAYHTPTADRGVVLAYDRMVLGEIRTIELEHFYDYIWDRGAIFKVPAKFRFNQSLAIQKASAFLPMYLDPQEGILPPPEQALFSSLWRAVRGKKPE